MLRLRTPLSPQLAALNHQLREENAARRKRSVDGDGSGRCVYVCGQCGGEFAAHPKDVRREALCPACQEANR